MDNKTESHRAFEDALASLQYVLIARRVQASDEPMRLNWKHFDIMAHIKECGTVMPSAISDKLQMTRSSTSKYLKSLEEKGLVEKTVVGQDKRSHLVMLTDQADNILENIYSGQRHNASIAASVLTEQEVAQFTAIAAKITAALDSEDLHTV